jgi:hypothetical protein
MAFWNPGPAVTALGDRRPARPGLISMPMASLSNYGNYFLHKDFLQDICAEDYLG